MGVLERMGREGHEQVLYTADPESGYRGIIAIHDTTLGPAVGGTRYWAYTSEEEALEDVLRLSRSMTLKSALAGLRFGGGKAVILADPRSGDREAVLRAHGRAIESLGGRYYAAEDVGTTVRDMGLVREQTDYVTGLASASGDPSPFTALGTFHGIRACMAHRHGDDDLEGRHVLVQGVGQVGFHLCRLLAEAGARLTVADIDDARSRRVADAFGASVVGPDYIGSLEGDVLAPCALGGAINDRTIGRLRVNVIAGAANNQLAEERHGDELVARGILYAPDFVINAGGIISVCGELAGWGAEHSRRKAVEIHNTLLEVFRVAESEGIAPSVAATRMAMHRIESARGAPA